VAAVPFITGFDPAQSIGAGELVSGFHRASVVGALACAVGALVALVAITDRVQTALPVDEQAATASASTPCFHCGLDAAPLVVRPD
jgi:hypothetical protein